MANSRFKFRAWDKENKKFSELPLEYKIKDINYYTDYIWNQFTGLTDKNGKEIYESDIVNIKSILYEFDKHKIEWNCEDLRWMATKEENGMYVNMIPIKKTWDFEVIGNIYENPELLEDKND